MNNDFVRALFSTVLCNILVWYDYALYGALIDVIGMKFFPIEDAKLQLGAVFAAFAVGFIMRPLGSLLFGHVGDKYGRKSALLQSVIFMSFPVLLMSIIPEYSSVGFFAPVMLIVLRAIQGFSLGGEAGNAVFLLEYSPVKLRGFISSFEVLSAIIGALLANIVVKLLQFFLGYETFIAWGWRLSFIFGAMVGIFGILLRYHTKESPIFIKASSSEKVLKYPLVDLFKNYKKKIFLAIGIDAVEEATLYVFLIFLSSYVSSELMSKSLMQVIQVILLLLLALLTLFFAYLSDLLQNRKIVLMFASLLLLVSAYPMFMAFSSLSLVPVVIAEIVLVIVIAASLGPTSAMVTEMFPSQVRYSALSISRNISSTLFGGFAPNICLFLMNVTGNKVLVSLYFIFVAVLSIVSLCLVKRVKINFLG